jgi:hypothetical protein
VSDALLNIYRSSAAVRLQAEIAAPLLVRSLARSPWKRTAKARLIREVCNAAARRARRDASKRKVRRRGGGARLTNVMASPA